MDLTVIVTPPPVAPAPSTEPGPGPDGGACIRCHSTACTCFTTNRRPKR